MARRKTVSAARPGGLRPVPEARPNLLAPRGPFVGVGWPIMQHEHDARALALQFQLEQSQWWSPERLEAHQLRQLQSLFDHAARTVPFYRERLGAAARQVPGQLTMEHLRQVPLLTRDEIQSAGPDLASRQLPAGHGKPWRATTSGSSGRPITFQATVMTSIMLAAMTMRGHLWHKRDLTQKNLSLRPPRANMPEGEAGLWAPLARTGPGLIFEMRKPIKEIFEHVLAEDPAYLQSHPHVVVGLLHESEATGRRPQSLREVRTYGECLDPWMRELCGRVWGVPVHDNYSSEEHGTVALECPESGGLHVMAENVLVEVLHDDGRPCASGESGRVVATGLHNFAMPMIRQELGDIAEVGAPCACGRGLPLLTRLRGRERNLFRLPDGSRVFPELYSEFGRFPAVRQWQVVQKTPERLEVKLALNVPLSEAETAELRALVQQGLGYPFEVAFVEVEEIPRQPSGKYQDFRTELD